MITVLRPPYSTRFHTRVSIIRFRGGTYWSTQHHAGFDIGDILGETAAVVPGPGAGEVSGHLNEALVDSEKTHRGHHHPAKAGRVVVDKIITELRLVSGDQLNAR